MNTNQQTTKHVVLGHQLIDDTHEEFVNLVKKLITANKATFSEVFTVFLEHTETHFAQEEKLMQQSKDPSSAEHQAEHRRVLGELKQFEKRISAGRTSLEKAYIRDKLPEWFALHTSTMDSALVAHLNKT